MNTSYREMLRDRVPRTVDLALKWCKAKERWLDHAYYAFIWMYKSKSDREKAAKLVLGINKRKKHFDFHKTIDWDNLSKDEEFYWKTIESWVDWFRSNMLAIEKACEISSNLGRSKEEIEEEIRNSYCDNCTPGVREELPKYLVKYILSE